MAREIFSTDQYETLSGRQLYRQNEAGWFVRGEAVSADPYNGTETDQGEDQLHQQGRDALRALQRKTARKHRQRRVIHHNRRR